MRDPSELFPQKAQSRREFLRRASAGLGAAAALGTPYVASSRPRHTSNKGKVGFALVGLGNLSNGQLGPALQKTKHAYLAGLVTGTPRKAREWSKKYNVPEKNIYNYETYDEIANNSEIDVIYIVLPNSMHAEYTIRAAEAGKHVLCEKPMATSVEDCQRMIKACRKNKRKLAIGYRLHFEPYNQELMRIGQQQVFGPIKMMEASFGFPIGDPSQWRLDKKMAGGGPLMDVGIYAVNAARYVTGEEPVEITAQKAPITDPDKFSEVEETLYWQMRFPSGATANCSTSYNAYVNRLYAAAPDGWARLQPAYSYGGLKGRTSQKALNFSDIDQFAAEIDDFARCILEDRDTKVPGEEGLQDLKILQAIYKAARTNAPVQPE